MNVVAPASAILKAKLWTHPSELFTAKADNDDVASALERVVALAGVDPLLFLDALSGARRNASDLGDELVARGVNPETLARALANVMGLPFGLPGGDERVVWRSASRDPRVLRTSKPNQRTQVYIAPPLGAIQRTMDWIERNGATSVVVTSREALREHAAKSSDAARLEAARHGLSTTRPEWSALTVLTPPQARVLALAALILLMAGIAFGWALFTALHATISLLFLSLTGLRFLVLADHRNERRRSAEERARHENELRLPTRPLPVYTVLVALRHEDRMVEPLVEALGRLNWPRSRLDIKLVCEADDPATVEAVRHAIAGRAGFEIGIVEPAHPRTKPKALNHALPIARGDYVVLYDAEDRPDPDQLLEAWLAFERAGPDLACVQAPLVIRNAGQNWLTAMFALEYAILFRSLLPFLARRDLPIPLGGTSNHFRRSALDHVGAWDSHNVAEDADLGIRLARHGYSIGVIGAPTSEIAPTRWRDWRNQRGRWVKGWIQTYFVHMRDPAGCLRQLGPGRMLAFQLLFLAMVAGATMHTAFVIYLGTVAFDFWLDGEGAIRLDWLMALDILNIVSAAAVFALLASAVATPDERPLVRWSWTLWAYWALVTVASLRSLRKLVSDPHGWEKTPHIECAGPNLTQGPPAVPWTLRAQAFSLSATSVSGRSSPGETSSCHLPSPS